MRKKYCYEPSEQEPVNSEFYLSDLEECKTIWFPDKGVIPSEKQEIAETEVPALLKMVLSNALR